jgi:uncharacterized protein
MTSILPGVGTTDISPRRRESVQARRVVFPVIHVNSVGQTLTNAAIARDAGADGIFLINHDVPPDELFSIAEAVSIEFSGWWLGLNVLGLDVCEVIPRLTARIDGLWLNDAFVREDGESQDEAATPRKLIQAAAWRGRYFGGVAFKHQRAVADVGRAASIASQYVDVVTTSGPATGEAPSVEKIRNMGVALQGYPLAIASGITPDNISQFLPHALCYLVATGISKNFYELDVRLLARLLAIVRHYNAQRPVPSPEWHAL